MRKIWIMCMAVGLGLAANAHAAGEEAPDFIFKVPLELKNLSPEVDKAGVACWVFKEEMPPPARDSMKVAAGAEGIPVAKNPDGTGNVNQVLEVKINLGGRAKPYEIHSYYCYIWVHAGDISVQVSKASLGNFTHIWSQADPRKPYKLEVQGPIPWLQRR